MLNYFVVTDREYTFGYQSLHNRPTFVFLNVHCPTGYNAHTLSLILPTIYCCGAVGTKLSSSRTSCTCTCSSKELWKKVLGFRYHLFGVCRLGLYLGSWFYRPCVVVCVLFFGFWFLVLGGSIHSASTYTASCPWRSELMNKQILVVFSFRMLMPSRSMSME